MSYARFTYTMFKKPRTEEELRKRSIRLLVVVIFVIYLLTPTGRQTFMTVANDIVSAFSSHANK